MPNVSGSSSPFQLPFPNLSQWTMAPWLFNAPATQAASSSTDSFSAAQGWGQALETQLRFWSQVVDVQRKFWSFYTPLLERTPIALNGGSKTVAEDEQGMEPAETSDGIPDPFELQMRTWNRFIDAHRSFWTSIGGLSPATNGVEMLADESAATLDADEAPRTSATPKPRKSSRKR